MEYFEGEPRAYLAIYGSEFANASELVVQSDHLCV